MVRSIKRLLLSSVIAGTSMLATAPADAVTFNLIDTGGTARGTVARQVFEAAAFYWSSVLKDNITVNLNIGFRALAPNVLGSTGSTTAALFNSQVYTGLLADMTSTADLTAVSNLPGLRPSVTFGQVTNLTMTTNALAANGRQYVDNATRVDNDGSVNNVALSVNTSVAKALGINADANGNAINPNNSDGGITFSTGFQFDFDPRNGITSTAFDFIGVAIHEIGHALGFRSGVDSYDAYTVQNTPVQPPLTASATSQRTGALETAVVGTQFDLFRYSAPGRLDWSTQNTPYFSIDGGQTQVFGSSLLSQGVRNGDGRQASHFKDAAAGVPQLGILDPTSGRGQMQEVTALDLTAFDVIGWNIGFDPLANPNYRVNTAQIYQQYLSALPEPASWAMMIAGVGFVGASLRRRQKVSVAFAA